MAKRCLGWGEAEGGRCQAGPTQGPPKCPEHPHAHTQLLQHPVTQGLLQDPRVGVTPYPQGIWGQPGTHGRGMEGGSDPIPTGRLGTAWYSRWVFTQGSAFVLLHLLLAVDVVEPVGVHRHQDAANVGLPERECGAVSPLRGVNPQIPSPQSLGDAVSPELT